MKIKLHMEFDNGVICELDREVQEKAYYENVVETLMEMATKSITVAMSEGDFY